MSQQPVEQIHVHFQGTTQRETHELSQTGQAAVDQVVSDLEQEGVGVSVLPVTGAEGDGARGVILGDVVINVVANAITMLLFRLIGEVITRVRLAHARRAHSPSSDVVSVQMGQRRISFPVDTPPASLYQQLELWTAEAPLSTDITIALGNTTPPERE